MSKLSSFLSPDLWAGLEGFLLGGGLIIAIGAQNAYLIRQGVRGERVYFIATLCFLSDAVLMVIGAAGVGAVIASDELLRSVAAWGGGFFLIVYGLKSAFAVFNPNPMDWEDDMVKRQTLWNITLTTIALTYLNPHVYLDTVVLVGGVAAQYDLHSRLSFTAGAIVASFIWFYGLAFGAIQVAHFFRSQRGAQLLDGTVCLVMWTVAFSLITGRLNQ